MPLSGAYSPTTGPVLSSYGASRLDIVEAEYWQYLYKLDFLTPHNMILFGNCSVASAEGSVDCNLSFATNKEGARRTILHDFSESFPSCRDYGFREWPIWNAAHSTPFFGGNAIFLLPYYPDSFLSQGPLGSAARNKYGIRLRTGGSDFHNMQTGVDRSNPATAYLSADQMDVHSQYDLAGHVLTHRWYYNGSHYIPRGRRMGWGTRCRVDGTTLYGVPQIDEGIYDLWVRELRTWPANLTPSQAAETNQLHKAYFEVLFPSEYARRISPSLGLINWTQEFWHGDNSGTSENPIWDIFKGETRYYIGGLRLRSATDGWIDSMSLPWQSAYPDLGDPTTGWGISPRTWDSEKVLLFGHTDIDEFLSYSGGTSTFNWADDSSPETPLIEIPSITPITLGQSSPKRMSLRERRKEGGK